MIIRLFLGCWDGGCGSCRGGGGGGALSHGLGIHTSLPASDELRLLGEVLMPKAAFSSSVSGGALTVSGGISGSVSYHLLVWVWDSKLTNGGLVPNRGGASSSTGRGEGQGEGEGEAEVGWSPSASCKGNVPGFRSLIWSVMGGSTCIAPANRLGLNRGASSSRASVSCSSSCCSRAALSRSSSGLCSDNGSCRHGIDKDNKHNGL